MPKISYVPYDETIAAIFEILGISIKSADYGGNEGWSIVDYDQARSDAWDVLNSDDYIGGIDYDHDGTDDWDMIAGIITGEYKVAYWSTEKAIDNQ